MQSPSRKNPILGLAVSGMMGGPDAGPDRTSDAVMPALFKDFPDFLTETNQGFFTSIVVPLLSPAES